MVSRLLVLGLGFLAGCAARTPEEVRDQGENDAAAAEPAIDAGPVAPPPDAARSADAKRPADTKRADAVLPVDSKPVITVSSYCKGSGFVICEDFEGGGVDPDRWDLTEVGLAATIDTTRAAAGSQHALHVKGGGPLVGGGTNYMKLLNRKSLPIKDGHVFIRAFIYVVTPYPKHHVAVMMIRDVTMPDAPYGPYVLQLYPPDNGGGPILSIWGASGEFSPGSSPVAFNQWSCLEWEVLGADTRELHLSLDDRELDNMKVVAASGWTPPASGQVSFYFSYGVDEVPVPPRYEYWIDQIAVSDQRIGCSR